jgi:hypothetical protein
VRDRRLGGYLQGGETKNLGSTRKGAVSQESVRACGRKWMEPHPLLGVRVAGRGGEMVTCWIKGAGMRTSAATGLQQAGGGAEAGGLTRKGKTEMVDGFSLVPPLAPSLRVALLSLASGSSSCPCRRHPPHHVDTPVGSALGSSVLACDWCAQAQVPPTLRAAARGAVGAGVGGAAALVLARLSAAAEAVALPGLSGE